MNKKAQELAELFDIDVDASLEAETLEPYDINETFEEKCENARTPLIETAIPDTEEIKENDNDDDVIKSAVEETSESKEDISSPPPVPPVSEDDNEDESEDEDEDEDVKEQEIPGDISQKETIHSIENPLGLQPSEFKVYQVMNEKYPRFVLFNGNPIYRNFYIYKFRVLRTLLHRFPVIDLVGRRKELLSMKIDHFMGDETPHPDVFREKLDDCFRARIRLSELLVDALEQDYSWDRHLELLQGKLYKDYDLKGAHKRDGLNAEHIQDIEDYVSELKGFILRARHIDGLLIAASESLSRQLTCIQMRQPSAGKTEVEYKMPHEIKKRPVNKEDPLYDLDGIDVGELITAPPPSESAVSTVIMGNFDPDDELMNVGLKRKEKKNG